MSDGNFCLPEVSQFKAYLDRFVFFHLGSDADVRFESVDQEISVRISHPRISEIAFRLSLAETRRLTNGVDILEDYLLDLLTRHRCAL